MNDRISTQIQHDRGLDIASTTIAFWGYQIVVESAISLPQEDSMAYTHIRVFQHGQDVTAQICRQAGASSLDLFKMMERLKALGTYQLFSPSNIENQK